ncbi:hypothetical protein FQB35_00400 [Crassaminicella thermophila]|uniref:Uncharacterized protein n=1 Tax=Crassaminicella thermophila TaxID=2599308 RepID=A0A5C0S8U7_CRATE|nr:hypothetical protein [Crassaminicella thermophila]QEK10953.1 hypothetical protein FQB35_00400 [Crassaminicella thermophila]
MKKTSFGGFLITFFIVKAINLSTGFSYNIFLEKLNQFNLFVDLAIWILVYGVVSLALSKFVNRRKDIS